MNKSPVNTSHVSVTLSLSFQRNIKNFETSEPTDMRSSSGLLISPTECNVVLGNISFLKLRAELS